MVFANTEENSKRLRLATDKGYNRDAGAAERNPIFLCANYRMTELQGAVALAQMQKVDSIVERRRKWCDALTPALKRLPGITTPKLTPGADSSWWFYTIRVNEDALGASTDEVCEALQKEGIPVAAHYIGRCVYEYPLFTEHSAFAHAPHPYSERKYGTGLCPVAEQILKTCIILPINEGYTEQDLKETVHAYSKVFLHYGNKAVTV